MTGNAGKRVEGLQVGWCWERQKPITALMQTKTWTTRILAFEIRLRRVGFAVLEEPDHLLDWGILRWRAEMDPAPTIVRRISPLLTLYSPSVVVLKQLNSARKARRRKWVITKMRRQLVARSIDVHMLKRPEVRRAFQQSGSRNKYQIAATIAEAFPELRPKLPLKRKPYQPEPYNAVIFDAIALGLAHRPCCRLCGETRNTESS